MISFFVSFAIFIAKYSSGIKIILSESREFTTSNAFEDVQQISVSALTSADELTYVTTGIPGFSLFRSITSCPVIEAAKEQPASKLGIIIFLSIFRIFDVSAIK